MKEVKIYTIVSDQLSPPITGESFCTDMVRHSDYAELEDTTTLKTHLESVVKTSLSELIRNAKATKKANLFIHI
ncbi:TPA: hypothetical protein ACNO3J_004891 [Salmonella enterica subsp. enterica serovar Newport]